MKIGQSNTVIQAYLNNSRLVLGREDNGNLNSNGNVATGSDGVFVPSTHIFTEGDGEKVVFLTSELNFSQFAYSSSGQFINYNGVSRLTGISPYIESVGDGYVRDNGIRVYTETQMEVWAYFKHNSNPQFYGTGWRKIMEINPSRSKYDGYTDIPFIDYYGNNVSSNGGVGMMQSIAFQASENGAEVKVISIPDGAAGTYDKIGGSDAVGEVNALMDVSGGNSYLEWDHSVKQFGVKYSTLGDSKEKYDRTFIIEDVSAAGNSSTVGNNYSWTLNTEQKMQNVTMLANDLYAVEIKSFSSTEDVENPGSYINIINFTLSSPDGNREEQLSESGMTYKVYIDLKH